MSSSAVRPLAGLGMVIAIAAIVVFSIGMFRGGFGTTVPVTVVSERAGLVMNPEAKVKMRGVQVGQVDRIENRPDGTAVLHLAMDPSQLQYIPANVDVNLASTTVFGAKSVELVAPADPSSTPLAKGQQLDAQHVTVETNTLFQQLTSVLKSIDPVQLNETLAAISGALNGRGEKFGQTITDFNAFFKSINPSLGNIARDLEVAPV
ncbi:MCE family protein, partial [Mycolicibacterium lacusdiani]|uniref:MCE family protein n=1 Tax=Mycolicibacterium lacusdiani TaxID=2895283 RepID=UPI001F385D4D